MKKRKGWNGFPIIYSAVSTMPGGTKLGVRLSTEPDLDNLAFGHGPQLSGRVVWSRGSPPEACTVTHISCRAAGVQYLLNFNLFEIDGQQYNGFDLTEEEVIEYLLTGKLSDTRRR